MLSILRNVFRILEIKERRKVVLMTFVMIINGFLQVLSIISVLPFISIVANPKVIETNKYLSGLYRYLDFPSTNSFLIFLGSAVLIFLLVNNSFNAFTTWLQIRFTQAFQRNLGVKLLRKYLNNDYEFFVNNNSSNLLRKVLDDANTVADVITTSALDFITNCIVSLFIVGIIVVSDPLLALLLFLFLSIVYGIIYFFNHRIVTRVSYRKYDINRSRFKVTQEMLGGIKDIKLLGAESVFLEEFSKSAKDFADVNSRFKLISRLPVMMIDVLLFGGLMAIVLYLLVTKGNIQNSLPLITLYAFSAYRIKPSVQAIFNAINAMNYSRASLEGVVNDLTSVSAQQRRTKGGEIFDGYQTITLKNVSFHYFDKSSNVVDKLNLSIKANSTIGFVGSTGSGKTTMVDIVMGLLLPQSGEIFVDGKPILEENIRSWQDQIGYVPQHIFLLDDTIIRNIAFGVPDKNINMAQVKAVASIANLNSFIEKMPGKYNSIVGERGVKLSGGQRQRIGIARALYRNPKLLVLDEATSSLDGITEDQVIEAINNLEGKMTIIMIAHRLTTLKKCDVIYIMSRGGIADSGSYQELLAKNNEFRSMAKENIVQ